MGLGLTGTSASATPVPNAEQTAPMTASPISSVLSTSGSTDRVLLASGVVLTMAASDVAAAQQAAAQASTTAQPGGSIGGDCGSSYAYMFDNPYTGQPWRFSTGFHVIHAAIDYSWNAVVDTPNSTYEYHASGGLFFDTTWAGGHNGNGPHGLYVAAVDPDTSYAILDTGSVCYSAGPYAETDL